jgi:hypothetical protein
MVATSCSPVSPSKIRYEVIPDLAKILTALICVRGGLLLLVGSKSKKSTKLHMTVEHGMQIMLLVLEDRNGNSLCHFSWNCLSYPDEAGDWTQLTNADA